MQLKDFNPNLMTTKVIFNEEQIEAGKVITIYRVDATGDILGDRVWRKGIIESIDFSSLKYVYYDEEKKTMRTGFLLPREIYTENITIVQWEDIDCLYIFTVE